MVRCIRESDTLARIGGDEFAVLAEGLAADEEVTVLAEKLLAAGARPLEATGGRLRVTVSIGIAVSPEDGDTVEALLERADAAMYRAKREGKNRMAR
jgi:diguanylate cyclase (GGDEF)-like protein